MNGRGIHSDLEGALTVAVPDSTRVFEADGKSAGAALAVRARIELADCRSLF